jgi:hypothetical protein
LLRAELVTVAVSLLKHILELVHTHKLVFVTADSVLSTVPAVEPLADWVHPLESHVVLFAPETLASYLVAIVVGPPWDKVILESHLKRLNRIFRHFSLPILVESESDHSLEEFTAHKLSVWEIGPLTFQAVRCNELQIHV